MAKKKVERPKVPATEMPKATNQARIELPVEEFDRLREAARKRGQSVSAFIRMAVLKEIRRVEEDRDL